ncbi:MAG: transcriptional regulator [Actinomycetota bacterium]|nr:transcriptional regulator [Actinomycetota bacterium]
MTRLHRDAEALAVLGDDLRRRLYLFVRGAGGPVTREEAAAAVRVSRKLSAFHLDKLADRGLLDVSYARPPGRGGPGAGRTSKYYAASEREFEITIPERHYDLLGLILLRAIDTQSPGETAQESARRAAYEAGHEIGRRERERMGLRRLGRERAAVAASKVLADRGYEPYRDQGGAVHLRNCPFHALAEESRPLVCRLNRELVGGLVSGLGNKSLEVVQVALEPQPRQCCVRLGPV